LKFLLDEAAWLQMGEPHEPSIIDSLAGCRQFFCDFGSTAPESGDQPTTKSSPTINHPQQARTNRNPSSTGPVPGTISINAQQAQN
jgi:hypothetical protein